jgi:hypothetical protein
LQNERKRLTDADDQNSLHDQHFISPPIGCIAINKTPTNSSNEIEFPLEKSNRSNTANNRTLSFLFEASAKTIIDISSVKALILQRHEKSSTLQEIKLLLDNLHSAVVPRVRKN